jgi:hypothetical protein
MTASIQIYFNSSPLTGAREWSEQIVSKVQSTDIPRMNGAIIDDAPALGSRIVDIDGIISGASADAARTTLDGLINLVSDGKKYLTLYNDRRIYAVKKSFKYNFPLGHAGKVVKWNVQFEAEDPFWEATSASSDIDNAITGGGVTDSVTINVSAGNAPTPVQIKMIPSGAMADLKVHNTYSTIDRWWRFTGTVASGKTLEVNNQNNDKLCYNSGNNALANLSGDFFLLECGVNNIISVTSDQAGTLKFYWTARWY